MAYIPVEYRNIHFLEPEGQPCVMLYWEEKNRYLPIWVSFEQSAKFVEFQEDDHPRRPRALDLVVDIVTLATDGIEEIRIVSQNEGEFYASLIIGDNVDIDARASDAILLALQFDIPLLVDDAVLAQASIAIAPDDVLTYLGFEAPEEESESSASGDAQADADFLEMMANMGVLEDELFGDDEKE